VNRGKKCREESRGGKRMRGAKGGGGEREGWGWEKQGKEGKGWRGGRKGRKGECWGRQ